MCGKPDSCHYTIYPSLISHVNSCTSLISLHLWLTNKLHLCRDPSPWWHVACIAIRSNSIRIPQENMWRAPLSGLLQGEAHGHSWTSHPDDSISYPDMLFGSLTKVSKPCYVILTACHNPHSVTCKAKGQERWQVASHDLWLSRSLTAVRRVMMTLPPPRGIMTSQKVFPPLKREAELLTLYKRVFTQGGR